LVVAVGVPLGGGAAGGVLAAGAGDVGGRPGAARRPRPAERRLPYPPPPPARRPRPGDAPPPPPARGRRAAALRAERPRGGEYALPPGRGVAVHGRRGDLTEWAVGSEGRAAVGDPGTGVTLSYHEATKHHLGRYARGPGHLDWANQPDPFRTFAGAPAL